MKIDRHGRVKILTTEEIKLLFNKGFTFNPIRDRTLFTVCLYTACRINECITLNIQDVFDSRLRVRPSIIIRRRTLQVSGGQTRAGQRCDYQSIDAYPH